jgi:serine phosphatase RsbU (regulator of sigma subunit)
MGRARLLLVDDDAAMLHTTERILRGQYDVRSALTPSQALDLPADDPFDLAIIDIRMPEMDGFDLMARLKARDPRLDVILMTGSTNDTDARLTRAIRENAFFFVNKPFHRDVLLALVARCLEARYLERENESTLSRLRHELFASRKFQQSLLPESTGRLGHLEIAALYEPYAELCGDFYDIAPNDSGASVLVTDVVGHGAPAAMLTGMIKLAFHGAAADGHAPGVVMQRIWSSSRLFPYDKHISAFCARIHERTGNLEYVSAGHPPAYVRRARGGVEPLDSSATLIHPALAEWHCEQRVVRFGRGDLLLVYTDGLIEGRGSESGEPFGTERLEALVASAPIDGAADLVRAAREGLRRYQAGRPLEDDLTIVAIRRD